MKKIQVIVGILFLTLILFACQKEEPKLFHLSYGDTPSSIKSRIYLKTLLDDEDIIWTTSNSDVISSTGVVTRPQVDAQPIEVTLDAEYKGKNYSF
ncbi:MAG: hypothetical protein RBT45_08125, partial [Acholeplasmataceae bacterium]|nr:hypothetical protein [Acholeplasmataceae bacterium]